MNGGGWYIDSPYRIKKQKNNNKSYQQKYNKCFQHAGTVAVNHKEIGKYTEKITKIKPFMNKYKWEIMNVPSKKDYWKKFEKNNVTISVNVLYSKKEKIYLGYVSINNSNSE